MRRLLALALLALPLCAQSNVLTNGNFENGTTGWSFYTTGTGSFTVSTTGAYSGSSANISITTIGSNTQLYQQPFTMLPSTTYTLTFYAKGSSGRTIVANVLKDVSPFTNYGLASQTFSLSTSWAPYTASFTSPSGGVSDARLSIGFGSTVGGNAQSGDQFWLDNISIATASSGGGGNTLQSDTFQGSSLNSFWQKVDTPGGGTVGLVSNQMVLTVPAGTAHDAYPPNGDAALLAQQTVSNTDFIATAQFPQAPVAWASEGLQAIQDNTHYFRCEVNSYGTGPNAYSAYINGSTVTTVFNNSVSSASQYWVQLSRAGNLFTCSYSIDGTNFTVLGTSTQTMTLSAVAVTADTGSSSPPAWTEKVAAFYAGTYPPSGGGTPPGGGGGGGTSAQCSIGNQPTQTFTVPAGAINVQSYGALGNNSHDDTANIQNAVNAVPVNGVVYFPSGTYKLSSTISASNNAGITYLGQGNATLMIPETTGTSILYSQSVNNTSVKGLIFDGGGIYINSSPSNPPSGWTITGNKFQNLFGSSATNLQSLAAIGSNGGVKNSTIDHNTFSHVEANNTTRATCKDANGTTQTNWPDCVNNFGIFFYGLDNTAIQYNTFDHVGEGIRLCLENTYTTSGIYIGHNHFTYMHRMGMEIQGAGGCGGNNQTQQPRGYLTNNPIAEYNAFDSPWDPYWNTFLMSWATPAIGWNFTTAGFCTLGSSGCTTTGAYAPTARYNYAYGSDSTNTPMSLVIEIAGTNATAYGNYIEQAKMQAGIQISTSPNGTVHDNYECSSVSPVGIPFHDEQDNPNSLTNGDPNTGANAIKYNERFTSNTSSTTCPASLASLSLGAPNVSGGTVTATATLSGILSTNVIGSVQFYADNATNSLGTDTAPPYTLAASTAGLSNGSHQLQAVATDVWCDNYSSAFQPFTVSNAASPIQDFFIFKGTISGKASWH